MAFGRVLSDGKIYGLIVDVMVHPDFRKQGYGQQLMGVIQRECSQKNLKVLQLLSSPEGKSLYERAGFKTCSPDSPGMIFFLPQSP